MTNFTIITNHSLVFFAELSKISKKELEEMVKRMKETAKMPDESLKKKKALKIVAQTSTEQDKETTSGLVFKRKIKVTTPPAEHSHSDGRTPYPGIVHCEGHQDIILVQECEAGSFKGKSLLDPSIDIPAYFKKAFLPSEDNKRLMAFDEDHLVCDAMKQIGQAFATGCLAVTKMKNQRVAKDLKAQENALLCKEIERLQNELKHSTNLQ